MKERNFFIYHILSNANEIIDTLTDHDCTDMEFVVVKNLTKLTVSPPKAYPVVIDWEQRNENFEKLSARITGENRFTIAIIMDGQSKKTFRVNASNTHTYCQKRVYTMQLRELVKE